MKKKAALLAIPFALLVVLFLFMNEASPLSAGPAGILFVFGLLYGFFLSTTFLLLHFGQKVLTRFGLLKQRSHIHPRKAYYMASVFACLPVFLMAINSIGELRILDVVLVGIFIGIATFYVARRT